VPVLERARAPRCAVGTVGFARMHIELVRQRLARLPTPLPPPRADLEAFVLRAPGTAGRRDFLGPVRDAAALALLYPGPGGEAHVVLQVRPSGDRVHAGEVALPGGKRERATTFPWARPCARRPRRWAWTRPRPA
jgi:hypothetical protein